MFIRTLVYSETDFYKQFVESRHPQLAQPRTQTYYQTLIHTDDWQHIVGGARVRTLS
jgi:hypothetical protein